jgi:hypothetical protein
MGDVTTLNAIAEEIKTYSDSCVPLSKQIVQLAEDFEFDGILKLADELLEGLKDAEWSSDINDDEIG